MYYRYAWVILFFSGLLGIFLSLPYILFGETLEPKGASTAQEIAQISPSLGSTVTAIIRVLGLSYLVVGVLVTAIAVTAYRRREMWPWYALWILPVFYVADIINYLSIGGSAWTVDAVGLAITVLTFLISPQFETLLQHRRTPIGLQAKSEDFPHSNF